MSHCQHHISTSFLVWSQQYICWTLSESWWHSSDLLTVHHVVQTARHSLCSKGELSGLFLIIHQQIPVPHSISTGASALHTWGCSRWCLSILGAVWSLLPPEWAPCLGHSLVPFLDWLEPSQLWLHPQQLISAWYPPTPRLFDTDYTLLGTVIKKGHRHWLYSCRHWIQWTVSPSRFLKLISQVSVKWSVSTWNSCL
jgi:hypothetical protein